MHISRTNISTTQVRLQVQATPEELLKAKQVALKKLAPEAKIAGFRAGKVPPAVLERNLNPNLLQSETIEHTLNILYPVIVREEKLRPITNPEIAIKKFVPYNELEFEVTIQTIGDIKLAEYKKVKLPKKPIEVSEKDITEVIKSLLIRAAERKDVTRTAKEGDQVWIDFKGTDVKGAPVQGADGKDYPLLLGSNTFIPGFESNLIGSKAGETKTFTLTFPKDYGVKALQGKKITFETIVNKVQEVKEPMLDDAFASQVGPFKTLKELKEDIKKQLVIERSREAERQYENELLETIAAKSSVEIPESLIESQIDAIEHEEKQNLAYKGQTFEEHLKEEGVNAEEHRKQKRPAAEQRVKISILLSEIADKENIEVTPQEVEVRLQMLKGQYKDPAMQAELDKPETLRDITSRIRSEKTLEKLKSYAQ